MRVLWFTNTPSLSAGYLNYKSIGGGWIDSLEAALADIDSIQLGISFNITDREIKPFTLNKTKYYPVVIKSHKGRLKNLACRWKKPIENENDIQPYLDVIEEFRPDVIHIFGTEGVFGLIASKTKVSCIIHLQGNLIICDHKWYCGLTAMDILRYSSKLNFLKGFGIYHQYLINKKHADRERIIFKNCRFFMGRTDWDRRISSVFSPNSKYFHCDEMMRPEFHKFQWFNKNNKSEIILLTVIRNTIYKGLETVFECKKILDKIDLSCKIIWKIAGISTMDEISNLLERKYKCTFKENNIQLCGSLQESELIDEMLGADIFIHPSHIDNSPNSVCEAMLLGMPIIATFAGGIPSLIEEKKEGLMVQDGDPFALAGAVIELIKNPNYAEELGINARSKAMIRHDSGRIVSKLLEIYNSIFLKDNVYTLS